MFPMGIYCLYDKKARIFLAPYIGENDEVGQRSFEEFLSDPKMIFSRRPQDYALYRLGKYHQDTGMIEPEGEVVRITDGQVPGIPLDVSIAQQEGQQKLQAFIARQLAQGVGPNEIQKMLNGGV
ncbi:MAG: nonstructural protein [Microviridae sp.]|nr:MAG: nonstructural protein [Microviridae sp.]